MGRFSLTRFRRHLHGSVQQDTERSRTRSVRKERPQKETSRRFEGRLSTSKPTTHTTKNNGNNDRIFAPDESTMSVMTEGLGMERKSRHLQAASFDMHFRDPKNVPDSFASLQIPLAMRQDLHQDYQSYIPEKPYSVMHQDMHWKCECHRPDMPSPVMHQGMQRNASSYRPNMPSPVVHQDRHRCNESERSDMPSPMTHQGLYRKYQSHRPDEPSTPVKKWSDRAAKSPTSVFYHAREPKMRESPLTADDDTLAMIPWNAQKRESPTAANSSCIAPMTHLESPYFDDKGDKKEQAPFYSDDLMSFFGHGNKDLKTTDRFAPQLLSALPSGGKLRNRLQLLVATKY